MKICCLSILLLISLAGRAQSDYIRTDSSREVGIKIYQRGLKANCRDVKFMRGSEAVKLPPEELAGFFIANNQQNYISGRLMLSDTSFLVFAREVPGSDGQIFEYRGQRGYRLLMRDTADESLRPIPKEQLAAHLQQLYPQDTNAAKLASNVRYSGKSLRNYLHRIEKQDFTNWPKARIAVEAGWVHTRFSPQNIRPSFRNIPSTNDYGIGLRSSFPFNLSSFGLDLGFFYTQYRINSEPTDEAFLSYYFLEAQQAQFSANLKYTLKDGSIRPYFSIGPRFSHSFTETHHALVEVAADSLATVNLWKAGFFSKNYLHLSTCMGLEFQLADEKVLYLETRYFYQLNRPAGLLIRNDFQFVMGFSF